MQGVMKLKIRVTSGFKKFAREKNTLLKKKRKIHFILHPTNKIALLLVVYTSAVNPKVLYTL